MSLYIFIYTYKQYVGGMNQVDETILMVSLSNTLTHPLLRTVITSLSTSSSTPSLSSFSPPPIKPSPSSTSFSTSPREHSSYYSTTSKELSSTSSGTSTSFSSSKEYSPTFSTSALPLPPHFPIEKVWFTDDCSENELNSNPLNLALVESSFRIEGMYIHIHIHIYINIHIYVYIYVCI
jgi:hypothetical protein